MLPWNKTQELKYLRRTRSNPFEGKNGTVMTENRAPFYMALVESKLENSSHFERLGRTPPVHTMVLFLLKWLGGRNKLAIA